MARYVVPTVPVVVIGCMMLLTTTHAKTSCSNLIPGAAKLLRGVDLTSLDMVPDDIILSELEGIKSPIFSFTCNKNRTHQASSVTYDRPDQIWHVDTKPGSWSRIVTKLYTSSEDIRKELNANVGIEGNYSKYSFSSASSYKNIQRTMSNSSKYVQDVSSFITSSTIILHPSEKLKLDVIFKQNIENLVGSFEGNPEVYKRFIKAFGTHYIRKGIFGGLLIVHHEIDKMYGFSEKQKLLSTEASVAIKNALSVTVGGSSGSSSGSTSFKQSITSFVKSYGGTEIPLETTGKENWQKSVKEDPWLMSGVVRPISDLIIGNDTKKDNLEKALKDHMLRSYLDELLRLVYAGKRKINMHYKILSDLASRIIAMKSEASLQQKDVDKLETDIEYQLTVPFWFKNNVQVCKECSETGLACSSFNEVIQQHHDHTCGDSSIYLSAKNGYPDWFGDIKLCTQWTFQPKRPLYYLTCIHGVQEITTCARLNKHLKYLIKKHSRKRYGCKVVLNHYITMPNSEDVPIWAKHFKICYFLESGCGDESSRVQCFLAGQKMFIDNPDGCGLKWGMYTVF